MQIEVAQLRTLTEQILEHLEDINLASIDLSDDYYWDTPSPQRYDPYIKPEELTMGQLSDDWEELRKILGGENDPTIYALAWLGAVLRAIGERAI